MREDDAAIDATVPRPVRRTSRDERRLVVLLAVVGGVLAALGGARPTDVAVVDVVYVGTAGAGLVFAGGRSRRTSWLLTAVGALWLASDLTGRVVAIGATAVGIHAARTGRRRVLGATVGALVAFVLGDLGAGPFHGSTTLFAAGAAAPMVVSGLLRAPVGRRRAVELGLSVAAGLAVTATLVFGVAVLWAMADVGPAVDAAERGFRAGSDGDEEAAAVAFDDATDRFDAARGKISGFWTLPARLVPVVGQHVRAVQVAASEGVGLSATAADTARTVDLDAIRFVDGRVDLDAIDTLAPALDRARRALERAHRRIGATRVPWLLEPVDERLAELEDELGDALPAAETAALGAREVPAMLGADGPVHWLMALTTPAEARGLGGLVGNWVLVEIDDGRVSVAASGRNEDLNAQLREAGATLRGPDQYLDRWGRFTPERFFQDVTLSPDLPMVATVMADLFEQAAGTAVDGVIVVDPETMGAVLDLTGPVPTSYRRMTATSVVPFLLEEQYELEEAVRLVVLQELVEGTVDNLTSGILPGPRQVAARLADVAAEDRLGVWWRDGSGQRLVEKLGLDARFPEPAGSDLIAVVHQNAGQNKMDVHLRRRLTYELELTDGRAVATATVELTNTLTDLDRPAAVVGSNDQGYPPGTNVAYVSLHTALDLGGARLDGESVAVERVGAFGGEAISLEIEIPAGATRVFEVDLTGSLALDAGSYALRLPHQPLVNDDRVLVRVVVDGVELDPIDLVLEADTVVGPGSEGVEG